MDYRKLALSWKVRITADEKTLEATIRASLVNGKLPYPVAFKIIKDLDKSKIDQQCGK